MSNYKVGDKVLVEFEIEYRNDNNGECKIRNKSLGYNFLNESEIYSLAPEFKNGEEVDGGENQGKFLFWQHGEKFIGKDSNGCFITESISGEINSWVYCRKPQQPKEDTKQAQFVTMPDGKRYKLVEVEE